jgi:hypothetical protein
MDGAKVFYRLRGFCSTMRKNAVSIVEALVDALQGNNVALSM